MYIIAAGSILTSMRSKKFFVGSNQNHLSYCLARQNPSF